MNKIDKMIDLFREAENLILESRTEMAEHSEKERAKFYNKGLILKKRGANIYHYLVEKVGIDEDYLNDLLTNEGV
jgi:hypothetical protein